MSIRGLVCRAGFVLPCVVLACASVLAQDKPSPTAAGSDLPKVFLDCVNAYCDFDYLRTEISFVDYVRDRQDADVHVLVTAEGTGGGGSKYTINFIGKKTYEGIEQVLHFTSSATSTDDEIRRGLANVMKMGLVRYVADRSVASEIQITRNAPKSSAQPAASQRDPWDCWYFRTSFRSSMSGESLMNSLSLSGSVDASRVTDDWKLDTYAYYRYGRSRYTFDDGTHYTSETRQASVSQLAVKSVTAHWSAGLRASAASSTYLNQQLAAKAAPAVEYNIFPYSESTRRQFTFNYAVGLAHFRYEEVTIFDKVQETVPTQNFEASGSFKQPWGSAYMSFVVSQYLQDGSKNRLMVSGSTDIRVFKGFSVQVYGDVGRIHDQIYLPKGSATPEEVLLQQRQLATSFSYYLSFGLGYSFGSMHNNVVNSRFGSSY
jgi:hypothetical protein